MVEGGTKKLEIIPIISYPVYVKRGALIPLISEAEILLHNGLGAGFPWPQFTWFAPTPTGVAVTSEVREPTAGGLVATAVMSVDGSMEVSISSHDSKVGLTIVGITEPSDVSYDAVSKLKAPCVHHYEKLASSFVFECLSVKGGVKVTVKGSKPSM